MTASYPAQLRRSLSFTDLVVQRRHRLLGGIPLYYGVVVRKFSAHRKVSVEAT
jgi:hypothetical protein